VGSFEQDRKPGYIKGKEFFWPVGQLFLKKDPANDLSVV